MLALYIEWQMRRVLAPILFDKDDRLGAEAKRRSVVAPAHRSDSALRKESSKRTADGLPVHRFCIQLDDLATLTKNRVHSGTATLKLLASPTAIQSEAFRLLQLTR